MFKEKANLLIKILRKMKRVIYYIIGVLWLAATIFIIYITRLPVEITEEIHENNIVQETVFSYKSDVIPFTLNPTGGITDINKGTFTKVTKSIVLHINSYIESDKPIKVNGTKKVILKLIAEDLWDHEFLLDEEISFNMEGLTNKIVDDDYIVDLGQLTNFIKSVEDEISIRTGKYTFEIKPVINGIIIYDGKEIPIDQSAQTFVDYSQTQIKVSEENKFSKIIPIISTSIIQQKCNVLGKEIPLTKARYIFTGIYLIILTILIIVAISRVRAKKLKCSEADIIDKKHKVRLINVTNEGNTFHFEKIILGSFTELLRISDEKEALIFRCANFGKIAYYVMDDGYIFLYEADNPLEQEQVSQRN